MLVPLRRQRASLWALSLRDEQSLRGRDFLLDDSLTETVETFYSFRASHLSGSLKVIGELPELIDEKVLRHSRERRTELIFLA